MSEERKKSGVAFWATVLVAVALIAYPLSIGPFFWLNYSGHLPASLIWMDHLYGPFRWVVDHSPDFIQSAVQAYLLLWMPATPMEYHGP